MSFNFAMEDNNSIFTTASETMASNTTETYTSASRSGQGIGESVFSPLAPVFQSRNEQLMQNLQEPRAADPAPTSASIDIGQMRNMRLNGSDIQFDHVEQNPHSNFYNMGENSPSMGSISGRTESNIWAEGASNVSQARQSEVVESFDFLVKCLSSASNYVAMLTPDEQFLLRSIRPNLLCDMLQEIAKARGGGEKRSRRALPNECAFCKNNGENEECYSSHGLKDWRGRVLCPVLRAFRCPRCGATGDRAHTIKYCPENPDGGLERSGSFASRRRVGSSFMMNQHNGSPSSSTPSPSPSSMSHTSLWNNF